MHSSPSPPRVHDINDENDDDDDEDDDDDDDVDENVDENDDADDDDTFSGWVRYTVVLIWPPVELSVAKSPSS